jgi:hypothetical protein
MALPGLFRCLDYILMMHHYECNYPQFGRTVKVVPFQDWQEGFEEGPPSDGR